MRFLYVFLILFQELLLSADSSPQALGGFEHVPIDDTQRSRSPGHEVFHWDLFNDTQLWEPMAAFHRQAPSGFPWKGWPARKFPQIVFYEFESPVTIAKFSFRNRAENGFMLNNPIDFDFIASADENCGTKECYPGNNTCGPWVTLKAVKGVEWRGNCEEKSWEIEQNKTAYYHCYGISVKKVSGKEVSAIQDLKMWKPADTMECSKMDKQEDYRGTKNVSASGKKCRRWDSLQYITAYNTPEKFPFAGLDNNYCRNPKSSERVWCYIHGQSPEGENWDYCDVPKCGKVRKYITWRDDLRCGSGYPASTGEPAECNPDSEHYCCSPRKWCGKTAHHCDCATCVNYKHKNFVEKDAIYASRPIIAREYVVDGRKKIMIVGGKAKSWDDSRNMCQSFGGDLATFQDEKDMERLFLEYSRINEGIILMDEFWIGGRRKEDSEEWQWLNGQLIPDDYKFLVATATRNDLQTQMSVKMKNANRKDGQNGYAIRYLGSGTMGAICQVEIFCKRGLL